VNDLRYILRCTLTPQDYAYRRVDTVQIRDHMGADVPLVLGLRVLQQAGLECSRWTAGRAVPRTEKIFVMTTRWGIEPRYVEA
jgi:hypothetical protein